MMKTIKIISNDVRDIDKVGEKIFMRVRKFDPLFDPEIVTVRFCDDLCVSFYIEISPEINIVVTKDIMESLGLDRFDLFIRAKNNGEKYKPALVETLPSILGMYDPSVADTDDVHTMYVVSVCDMVCGASVVLYKGVLDDIIDKMGDIYILPSSIHEMLVIPADVTTPEVLKDMVTNINNTVVDEEDRLTDSIYSYDKVHGFYKVC